MSTSVEPPTSGKYVDFQEYVDFQLRKAQDQIRTTDLLTSGTLAAVFVVGYLLLFVVSDQWLFAQGLPPALRWLGLVVWVSVLGYWLASRLVMPGMRRINSLFAAREVERSEPDLRSNLLNWADLQGADREVDPAVLRAIERQAAVQLSKMDVSQAIDHRPLLNSGYALLAVVVLFCIYAIATPKKLGPSLARVLPMLDVAAPTRTEIRSVTPGDAQVLARGVLEVTVDLAGVIPEKTVLYFSTEDRKFRDEVLALQADGAAGTRFRGLLAGESGQGLLQNLTYRIEAGDAVSRTYHVRVDQPPSVRVNQVSVTPPAYTQLSEEKVAGGNFSGWEGSIVQLQADCTLPVASAVVEFLDEPQGKPTGEQAKVVVTDGTKLSANWKLEFRSDGTFPRHYRVQCRTEDGRSDPAPVVYEYTIRRDQPPNIVLLAPERDLELPANAVIPLLAQANDPDFQLGPVTLEVQQAGKTIARETLSSGGKQAVQIQHELSLKPLGLKGGDEISFWLEAQDNRQPQRNRKQTPPLKIRIQEPVSPQQVQEQLAEEKARQQDQIAELAENDRREESQTSGDREMPGDSMERPPGEEPMAPMNEPPAAQPPNAEMSEEDGGAGAAAQTGESSSASSTGNSETGQQQSASPSAKPESSESQQPPQFSPDGEDDQQVLERLLQKGVGNKPGSTGGNSSPEQTPPGARQPMPPESGDTDAAPKPSDSTQAPMPKGEGTQPSAASQDQSQPGPSDATRPMPSPMTEPGMPSESGMPPEKGATGSDKGAKPDAAAGEKSDEEKSASSPDRKQPPQNDSQGTNQSTPGGMKPSEPKPPMTPSQLPDGSLPEEGASKPESSKPEMNSKEKGGTGKGGTAESQADKPEDATESTSGSATGTPKPAEMNRNPSDTKSPEKGGAPMPMDASNSGSEKPAAPKNETAQPAAENSSEGTPNSPSPKEPDGNRTEPGKPSPSKNGSQGEPGKNGGEPSAGTEPKPKNGNQPASDPGMPTDSDNAPMSEPGAAPKPQTSPREGTPNAGDMPPRGEGRPKGQRSEQPQTGENGASAQSSEGAASNQPGGNSGKPSGNPGSQPPSTGDQSAGKKNSNSGPGSSKTQEGGSGKEGMPSKSDSSGGQESSKGSSETNSDTPSNSEPMTGTEKESSESAPQGSGKESSGKGSEGKSSPKEAGGGQESGGGKESGGGGKSETGGAKPEKSGPPKSSSESPENEGSKDSSSQKDEGGSGSKGGSKGDQASGGDQGGQGKQGSEGQSGGSGNDAGMPGTKVGQGSGNSQSRSNTGGGGSGTSGPQQGPGPGAATDGMADATVAPAGDTANLEFKKQATELVLQQLKNRLERGEVDPELLQELGWTGEQLQRFIDRMDTALKAANEAPETALDQARRVQFEEMLKHLDLQRRSTARTGGDQPSREVDQVDSRRAPVPVEYRKAWEQYTRSLSKTQPAPAPKK